MLKLLLRANNFFLCNYYGNILKISKKTYEILEQLFILNIVCKKREQKNVLWVGMGQPVMPPPVIRDVRVEVKIS